MDELQPTDPTFDLVLDQCFCSQARRASRAVSQHYDRLLRPLGIKSTQLLLLASVRGVSLSVNQLAQLVGLDQSSLSRNLDVLEKQGWVKLTKSRDDQRYRLVQLTDGGSSMVARALPIWRRAQQDLRAHLGPRAADALSVLSRLAALRQS